MNRLCEFFFSLNLFYLYPLLLFLNSIWNCKFEFKNPILISVPIDFGNNTKQSKNYFCAQTKPISHDCVLITRWEIAMCASEWVSEGAKSHEQIQLFGTIESICVFHK